MESSGFRDHVGLTIVEAEGEDVVTVALDADDRHLNAHGTVHGGAIATLCDVAMGAAVFTGDNSPVTIEMKVTYLEPVHRGRVLATARVRRRGSRVTIVEADVADDDGAAVAHAIATFTTL
jgi:acyl-CoA thioesterase